jgi:hypothetical protein
MLKSINLQPILQKQKNQNNMKIKVLLLLLLFSLTSYSQNLTLDEVVGLRKKNIANVEEFLTAKNWSYIGSNEPESDKLGNARFAYGKSSYDDKAEAFIKYLYSENTGRKRISFQVHKKDKYNLYLTRIKSLGCKLIKSKISDGGIEKVYQGATTTFIIDVNTQSEKYSSATTTVYHFFIIENSDYEVNYKYEETDEYYPTVIDTVATSPTNYYKN